MTLRRMYFCWVQWLGRGAAALVLAAATGYAQDHFEPNNSFAAAAELGAVSDLTETNLSIHAAGDGDYYRFTATQTGDMEIEILFVSDDGDLDLSLLDTAEDELAYSDSTDDDEWILYEVTNGVEYVVCVEGYGGATNVYDLILNQADPIVSDRFETNDTVGAATDLGTLGDRTETNLSIYAEGDVDYYRFTAADTGTLTVGLFLRIRRPTSICICMKGFPKTVCWDIPSLELTMNRSSIPLRAGWSIC